MPTLAYSCISAPLNSDDFAAALTALGVDAATAWTILEVESGKAGYLPDRRPQILFESHQFHNKTGGIYDASYPAISRPAWVNDYVGGAGEYTRLAQAYALNPEAALESASWGIGQIMGFNFGQNPGFASAADLVAAACASESEQLKQFQNFLIKSGTLPHLQAHDWDNVALHYNGNGQVPVYSAKLAAAYASLQNPAHVPDLNVRAAQLYLNFLNAGTDAQITVDGIWGPHTQAALNAFLTAQGLAAAAAVDQDVVAQMVQLLPAAADLDLS